MYGHCFIPAMPRLVKRSLTLSLNSSIIQCILTTAKGSMANLVWNVNVCKGQRCFDAAPGEGEEQDGACCCQASRGCKVR